MRTIQVQLVGGPTVILEIDGLRIITDPTFDPPSESTDGMPHRTLPAGVGIADVGHLDVALVSHDQHPDNLDRSGRALLAEIPLVLTTPQSAERLGGTAHGLAPFDEVTVERASGRPLRITALPALHGPPGAETASGPVTGFLLAGDDVPSVYVSGDNASLDVVREIVEFVGAVDVAVLFAGAASVPQLLDGATLTLTSVDAAEAARLLRARVVIPVHCEGWSHYQESSSTLRTAFRSAGLAQVLTVVDAGQTVTL